MKFVVVALLLFAATGVGEAAVEEPVVWACRAESKYAYGWARNDSQKQARYDALRQCASRTPIGRACKIKHCKPK